jgi:hypothetical protein
MRSETERDIVLHRQHCFFGVLNRRTGNRNIFVPSGIKGDAVTEQCTIDFRTKNRCLTTLISPQSLVVIIILICSDFLA